MSVAPRHFAEPKFVATIEDMLLDAGVPAAPLELEVTESTALSNVDRAVELMQQLRDMGVRISLDDFRAGYSAMNHLRRLPVHCLKLEQSYVRGAPVNPVDAAVVRGLTLIAQTSGIEIVAEGIETSAQLQAAQAAGVDMLQGYLIGQPRAEHADPAATRALAAGAPPVAAPIDEAAVRSAGPPLT